MENEQKSRVPIILAVITAFIGLIIVLLIPKKNKNELNIELNNNKINDLRNELMEKINSQKELNDNLINLKRENLKLKKELKNESANEGQGNKGKSSPASKKEGETAEGNDDSEGD